MLKTYPLSPISPEPGRNGIIHAQIATSIKQILQNEYNATERNEQKLIRKNNQKNAKALAIKGLRIGNMPN